MTESDDHFQQHIHVFRAIAIMLIVCAHTVPSLDWTNNHSLGQFIDAVANESSIFFFFIAGYLFQFLSSRFTYRRYLVQKLKTVILPYVILSIPALIIFTIFTKRIGMWPWFYDLPIASQIGLFFLTGKHLAPLWFVPTISLFYLAAPLFLLIDQRYRSGYWAIVPLLMLSAHLGRGGQYGPLNFALYLLPMYLLGMAVCRYRVIAMKMVDRWWPLLALVAASSFAARFSELPNPPYWQVLIKPSLALLLTWLLLRHHKFFGGRLDYIAEVSFGIFFIHAYFISFIKVLAVYAVTGTIYTGDGGDVVPGSLMMFIAYAGTVLGISVAVIWLGKKLFGDKSRMVIGA